MVGEIIIVFYQSIEKQKQWHAKSRLKSLYVELPPTLMGTNKKSVPGKRPLGTNQKVYQ